MQQELQETKNIKSNNRCCHKKYQRGSSLVMAVVVIMVVMVLGTTLMIGSISHLKLTNRQALWSSDYYALDSDAETLLYHIDYNLSLAETSATAYINQRIFEEAPDASLSFEIPYEKENVSTHEFSMSDTPINFTDLTYDVEDNLIKDDQYLIEGSYGNSYQMYFYQKYLNEVALKYDPLASYDPDVDDPDSLAFAQLEKDYLDEIYNELYFIISKNILKQAYSGIATINYTGGYDAVTGVYYPNLYYQRVLDQPSSLSEDGTGLQKIAMRLRIVDPQYEPIKEIQNKAFTANPVWTNAITAGGGITLNGISNIHGSLYAAAYDTSGSLVTDNGLSVAAGANHVYGNVYTRGDVRIFGDGTSLEVLEANAGGVYDQNYKAAVYDANSAITDFYIEDFTVSGVEDLTDRVSVLEQTAYADKDNFFWFYNRDSKGGNIYSRDVHALGPTDTRTSKGVALKALNVWTYGDIVMEAYKKDATRSKIEIDGNAIGLLNESDASDPNASSTIRNNSYDDTEGGDIFIRKAYVPGMTFFAFDKLDGASAGPYYFKTFESITGNSSYLFSEIYEDNIGTSLDSPSTVLNTYTYIGQSDLGTEEIDFDLKPKLTEDYHSDEEIIDMLNHIKPGTANTETINERLEDKVVTGINLGYSEVDINSATESQNALLYAEGLVVGHLAEGGGYGATAQIFPSKKAAMAFDYSNNIVPMKANFIKKTMSFGFENSDVYKYIRDTVDISAIRSNYTANSSTGDSEYIRYLSNANNSVTVDSDNKNIVIVSDAVSGRSNLTIDLYRDFNGIIYCDGDLQINYYGNVKINGTIIADGNVTLDAGNASSVLNVTYDENSIAKLITLYSPVKAFFAPYEKGAQTNYQLVRYTTGMFSGLERFRIVKWQEQMNE